MKFMEGNAMMAVSSPSRGRPTLQLEKSKKGIQTYLHTRNSRNEENCFLNSTTF